MGSSRHSRIPSRGLNWGGQHAGSITQVSGLCLCPDLSIRGRGVQAVPANPHSRQGASQRAASEGKSSPPRPSQHAQDVGHIPEAPVASKSWSPPVRWVAASIQPLRGLVCGLLLLGALGSQLLQNFLGYFRWRDCH